MSTLFKQIADKQIPAFILEESNDFIAFLDVFPVTYGHTLVVPKKEVDYIFDLDDDTYLGLMAFSKQVAQRLKAIVPCKKVAVSVIGLEVPHAHVHLLPINSIKNVDFNAPKVKAESEALQHLVNLYQSSN